MDKVILDLIVAGASGLAAGYFTNKIAIELLFWPIKPGWFGIQGVFPKRQAELAKVVGEKLSKQVLPQEEIVRQLSSPEVKKNIEIEIEKIVHSFLFTNFYTIEDVFNSWVSETDTRQNLKEFIAQWLEKGVNNLLTADSTKEHLRDFLKNQAFQYRESPIKELLSDEIIALLDRAQDKLIEWCRTSGSTFILEGVQDWLRSEQSLFELFPNISENDVENVVDQVSCWLLDAVQKTLENPKKQEQILKWLNEQITNALQTSPSGFMGSIKQMALQKGWSMFGDEALHALKMQLPNAIASLPELIEQNKSILISNIHRGFIQFLQKPIKSIWNSLPESTQKTALHGLESVILSQNLWEIITSQTDKAKNSILDTKVEKILPIEAIQMPDALSDETKYLEKLHSLHTQYKIIGVYSEQFLPQLQCIFNVSQDCKVILPSDCSIVRESTWEISKNWKEPVVFILLDGNTITSHLEVYDAVLCLYNNDSKISSINKVLHQFSSIPLLVCEVTNTLALSVAAGGFQETSKTPLAKYIQMGNAKFSQNFSYIKYSQLSFEGWEMLPSLQGLHLTEHLKLPERLLLAFESKNVKQIENAIGLSSLKYFIQTLEQQYLSKENAKTSVVHKEQIYDQTSIALIGLLLKQDTKAMSQKILDMVFRLEVGTLGSIFPKEKSDILTNQLASVGFSLLKENGANIATKLEIAPVVEKKITELPAAEVGESVKDISGSAFWSLEFFGALLGLVASLILMGFYIWSVSFGVILAILIAVYATYSIIVSSEKIRNMLLKKRQHKKLEEIRHKYSEEE